MSKLAGGLEQPVVVTSSSSIRPRSLFEAAAYSRAHFFVISRLVAVDSSDPIPPAQASGRAEAGISRADPR